MNPTQAPRKRRPHHLANAVLCLLVAGNAMLAWSLLAPNKTVVPAAGAQVLADALDVPAEELGEVQGIDAMMQPASEYLMIPANLISANQDIIYVLDTRTGALSALAYNRADGLTAVPPLQLGEFFGGR